MQHAIQLIKGICYLGLAGAAGYIAGDEISNRAERAKLREFCYVQQADALPDSPNEMQDLIIKYRCRNAIP